MIGCFEVDLLPMSLGSCLLIEKNVGQGHLNKLRQIYWGSAEGRNTERGSRFCTPNVGLSCLYGLGTRSHLG